MVHNKHNPKTLIRKTLRNTHSQSECGGKTMRILELFSGSGILSETFREGGHFAMEFDILNGMDILKFEKHYQKGTKPFDVIWASPPCETFSLCGHNYKRGEPQNSKCYLHQAYVVKTLEIIRELKPKVWFIENPRAGLRSQPFMRNLPRKTITFCQYGENRMKPTDIWTNSKEWKPRSACKNGDPCHERAPRGSRTGTQGLKNAEQRGKLPKELCIEILEACEREIASAAREQVNEK